MLLLNILDLSVHDEGYSRNASCALNFLSTFFFFTITIFRKPVILILVRNILIVKIIVGFISSQTLSFYISNNKIFPPSIMYTYVVLGPFETFRLVIMLTCYLLLLDILIDWLIDWLQVSCISIIFMADWFVLKITWAVIQLYAWIINWCLTSSEHYFSFMHG